MTQEESSREAGTAGSVALAAPAATLARYLPAYAARRLASGPLPAVADEELGRGAVLFADLSGFTPLTERLTRHGPVGAEELSRLLNDVFGLLADVVAVHGGDVVGFAGDALIALWTDDDAEARAAALSAAVCGLAAQAAIARYAAPEGGRLSLRVGIGAGEIRLPRVGGRDGRWLHLALGAALEQVRPALRRARPGDVVVSAEAWDAGRLVGEPLDGGLRRLIAVADPSPLVPAPPAPVLDAALLESLAPTPVLARLAVAGTSWSAELRQVSVVFVDLVGGPASPSLEVLDTFAAALQGAADRYQGTLKELSADDKGTVGILVFGLPPLAHEDDRRRAVLAALDVRGRLTRAGLDCGIGVTSGRAFCGSIETSVRSDYAVIGEPMNLAARLMQAAPGEILCDDTVYQSTRVQVRYESRPVMPAKGRAQPVAVWRPLGPAPRVRHLPPMIDRVDEQRRLLDRLDAVERGTGGVVVIEGDAGIGKSRLVAELVRVAETRGMATAVGAGDAIDRATPYHPWRTAFAQLLGPDLMADPVALRARFQSRLVSDRDRSLLPLLTALLPPLGFVDNEITSQMTGTGRAENTNQLVVRIIQRAVELKAPPFVVVLDDAQWLDSASWALAELLARQGLVLLVVSKRAWEDGEPPPEAAFLEDGSLVTDAGVAVERMVLGGLGRDDIAALLAERLGAERVSDEVAGFIVEKAEGNPFFSEELAYSLRDAGVIAVAGGVCQVVPEAGDLRTLDLPSTLEALVMGRVDRLPPAVQLTLKVASVVGRTFSLPLLYAVHPVAADRPELASHLETLVRLDLVVQDGEEATTYSFKHAAIRDVAYNLLLFSQRHELHAAVARWYEEHVDDDPVRGYALLAHHWAQAGVCDRAAENLGMAGEHALRTGAYREAVGFLHDALSKGGDSDRVQRAGWERRLGEAELGRGRPVEARRHLRRAVALAGWPEPASRVGLVLRLLSQLAVQALARLGFRRILFRTRASAEQNAEAAAGFVRLVETYWLSNETLPLLYASVAGLNVAERGGPSPDLARAYAIVCLASSGVPVHRLARLYARRAVATAEAVGQLAPIAYTNFLTSIYAIGVGRWAEAEAGVSRALEIFDEIGDRRLAGDAKAALAMIRFHRGDLPGSAVLFDELHQAGERHGNVRHQVWGLAGQSLGALRKGRPDDALRLLQVAHMLVAERQHDDPVEVLRIEALLALIRLRRGDDELAIQSVDAAWEAVAGRRSMAAVTILQSYWALADAAIALWERGEDVTARTIAKRALLDLRRLARRFPIARPRALVANGTARWLRGRTRAARRSWARGLRAAERMEMPYEIARAHYEAGRHLPEDDPDRIPHLEAAADIFARLGTDDDLARTMGMLAAARS